MEREEQTMNITYEKCGDYLIPNLILNLEPEGELRKFGLMRKYYLKEYKRGIYTTNIIEGIECQYKKETKAKCVFPSDSSLEECFILPAETWSKNGYSVTETGIRC